MGLRELFGIELPVIQAPMAGSQGSELAVAVSNAGGLGSLPCALLSVDSMLAELNAIRSGTSKPFNVNFFCHTPPEPDARREAAWRELLAPYFKEYGIALGEAASAPARAPFSAAAADALQELGAVFLFIGTPLLLCSWVGLAIAGPMIILLAARIPREERLLTSELDGYADYRRRVRYRLLPLLW